MNNYLQFITIDKKEGLFRRFHSYYSGGTNPTNSSSQWAFTTKVAVENTFPYRCRVCGALERQVT